MRFRNFCCLLIGIAGTSLWARPDFICVTVPKSGTHLWKHVVSLMQREDNQPITLFAMHYNTVREACWSGIPKMMLVRDLRDVLVSTVHHIDRYAAFPGIKRNHPDLQAFLKLSTFEEKLMVLLTPGNALFALMDENFRSCVELYHDNPRCILRFEELVGSKGGGSDALQLASLHVLAEAAGFCLTEEQLERIQDQAFGGTPMFRKGQIGSWREAVNSQLCSAHYRISSLHLKI